MLSSKQRAKLKAAASKTDALYQLGKDGIDENYIIQVNKALDAKELIKIHMLDNVFDDIKFMANQLSEATDSDIVQIIGSKIVLYRRSRIKEKRLLSLEIDRL